MGIGMGWVVVLIVGSLRRTTSPSQACPLDSARRRHLGIHLGVLELSYRSRSTEHSVATLLEAALFEAFVNHAPAIGPHKARPHLASHPAATPFICGENGGPETEVSAVRHADGVFFCIEHLERLDRAEELVLHERYVQTIDFEERRGIVGTARTLDRKSVV